LLGHEPPARLPRARLEGRLLLADGTPAAGWAVAKTVILGSVGGTTGGPMYHSIDLGDVAGVPSDGRFVVDLVCHRDRAWTGWSGSAGARTYLAVLSPEGVPLIYALAPGTWPKETRQITVRVPAVRRFVEGRAVFADGKSAAERPIWTSRFRCGWRHYDVSGERALPDSPRVPLWRESTFQQACGSRINRFAVFRDDMSMIGYPYIFGGCY